MENVIKAVSEALKDFNGPKRKAYYDFADGTVCIYKVRLHGKVLLRVDVHSLDGKGVSKWMLQNGAKK